MDVSSSEQGLSFGFLFACILTSMIHCSSFFPQKNISIFQGSLPASVTAVVVAAYDCFGDLRTNSFVFLSLGLQFIRYLCMWVSVSCGGRCSGGGGGGGGGWSAPPPPPRQNKTVAVATVLWAYPSISLIKGWKPLYCQPQH